jgi:UDP-N-acetylmuramyl-tripeptide synthetase/UDP-N-acetylmuramoyl-tripeptide--D-alanyl-D-alanine ligase
MEPANKAINTLINGLANLRVVRGDPARVICGLSADSRLLRPGMLFAALPGTVADGRAFITDALTAGATALLVEAGSPLPALNDNITVVETTHIRQTLPHLAAAYYQHRQPACVTAVTGTNGKTSTASFLRQIWAHLGLPAASLGTLGLVAPGIDSPGKSTTPDPISLQATLANLADAGVNHLCMEASSHGLSQHRLDGVRLAAAAFTNITRDHMDYHHTLEAYFATKCRLFSELLPADGTAVLNADDASFPALKAIAQDRGLAVISYGERADDLRLERREPSISGQRLNLRVMGTPMAVDLPLAGAFQAANALTALGLALACGAKKTAAVHALEHLQGVPGRLEKVGDHNGASVFVDYAHTPDALEVVLLALRPHVSGKLVVVFGCGGDRDAGKRPLMGAIAARLADRVIVTDDNPRSENAAEIRRQILIGCPNAEVIADRRHAIIAAVGALQAGDIVLIAGKGHESGQIIGDHVIAFDDRDEARAAMALSQRAPLWRSDAIARATNGIVQGNGNAFDCYGVSIDSRTVAHGDLFLAIQGPSHDGHAWVLAALHAGAAGALVHRLPDGIAADDPLASRLILVADTFVALNDLGRAGRDRFSGRVVGVTGSVGKTSSKEMLALALAALGPTHAAVGSFNNHWGVPLTLARMPADAAFAVIEMGMNHAGEIRTLTALARPHVAVITTIAGAHIEHLGSLEAIADAKGEIFDGVQTGGTAIIPADAPHADRLLAAASAHGLFSQTFGTAATATIRLLSATVGVTQTDVVADFDGQEIAYTLGTAGLHWAMNSLAVLGAVNALSPQANAIAVAAHALAHMQPPKGRGQRHSIPLDGQELPLTVIDEAYNANPVSLAAALAALATLPRAGQMSGRRIVALGDMLELGADGPAHHAAMADAIAQANIDVVFTAGPLSAHLFNSLPPAQRGAHASDSAALAPLVAAAVTGGDVVMAKGSAGSRMGRVIDALLALKTPNQTSTVGKNVNDTAKE